MVVFGVFVTLINIINIVPHLIDKSYGDYHYAAQDVYCWEVIAVTWFQKTKFSIIVILLALPVLPILISCIISTVAVLTSLKLSKRCGSAGAGNIQRDATITILIVTGTYILCNIPIFINFILYLIVVVEEYQYPEPYYKSVTMYWYSWGFTYVMCVVLNASVNPIIYICRMGRYKNAMIESGRSGLRRVTRRVSSVCVVPTMVVPSAMASDDSNNNINSISVAGASMRTLDNFIAGLKEEEEISLNGKTDGVKRIAPDSNGKLDYCTDSDNKKCNGVVFINTGIKPYAYDKTSRDSKRKITLNSNEQNHRMSMLE